MDTIKVVCGIIYKDDKVFICKRKPHKSLGGYWEFPGGKVEEGEEYEDSLIRELKEELDMDVSVDDYFDTSVFHYDTFSIELLAYKCTYLSASYILTDHDEYEWIDPALLLTMKLAPADIPIANKLQEKHEQ